MPRKRLTRRSVLGGMGAVLFIDSLSHFADALPQAGEGVISTLSTYMAAAGSRPLPAEIAELTKQHLLDTFAAMISGSRLAPGKAALSFAQFSQAGGPCSIVTSGIQCGPIEAALANGVLAHADETDDSHSPSLSHPGCAVVPAALACGEEFSVDGSRFLRAIALGYDIGPRVTMTMGAIRYQTQTHRSSHAVAGAFGSAAAAACCASLNAQQMRWVLDYTAQQASGITAWQRDTDHVEKAFVFAGMPARTGVTSALLVHAGWTGVDDIFAGTDNFFAAFAPDADPSGLIDALGERFEVKRTNIKKWSVGSPIQAPLDALEALQRQHPFQPDAVKSITVNVATQEGRVVDNREMPDVSLQQMMAIMLMDRTVSFAAAHDISRMKDPATERQRAKIQLVADPALDALLPRRIAVITVALADGTKLTERVEAVRGSAENPMTWDEVTAKSRDLIAPVLGADRFARLLERVRTIETCSNLRELRRLLRN
ncbi:MAG: MmgE/PrpD family protein [Acidobacteriaceae bacterium]|nr:MmgE/PrpD family protein [Acidobacteriaceae bacterium]